MFVIYMDTVLDSIHDGIDAQKNNFELCEITKSVRRL